MSGDELNPHWTNDNVLSLVKKEVVEEKGYIEIIWKDTVINDDGTIGYEREVIQADHIGAYEPIPGMMIAMRDNPEGVVGFFNTSFIRSIKLINNNNG